MSLYHEALSHYWHLRSQDEPPAKAADHVRHRYGVTINYKKLHQADLVATMDEPVDLKFGSEFTRPIIGCIDTGRRS